MSIKRNTIANYIGQAYTSLIGLVMLPLYLSSLGPEGYGLVGFFAVMQAWFALLDAGLSPTLSRQISYLRGKPLGLPSIWPLLRSIEWIFGLVSIVIVISIFLSSSWIANTWLKTQTLDGVAVKNCISIMGLMIGLRLFGALYRSGIQGMENMVWLNGANIAIATLRYAGAYILLKFLSSSIEDFFQFQLIVCVLEVAIFFTKLYSSLPHKEINFTHFNWDSLREILPFTISIAYSSLLWAFITQSDKVILSGILELNEYGYFSLVTLICSSITLISSPISQAIIPRITLLVSQGKINEMLSLYRKSSQFIVLISSSGSLILGLFSQELIIAWTGDFKAAEWGGDLLIWFALGNGILSIGAFQYYLQNAFGELKLHVIGSTLSAIIQVPLIYYSAINYGAYGAGIMWFTFRTLWFAVWTPIVHKKFVPGFHLNWLLKDILPVLLSTITLSFAARELININISSTRPEILFKISSAGISVLLVSAFSVKSTREYAIKLYASLAEKNNS